jgi:hypothetical protein
MCLPKSFCVLSAHNTFTGSIHNDNPAHDAGFFCFDSGNTPPVDNLWITTPLPFRHIFTHLHPLASKPSVYNHLCLPEDASSPRKVICKLFILKYLAIYYFNHLLSFLHLTGNVPHLPPILPLQAPNSLILKQQTVLITSLWAWNIPFLIHVGNVVDRLRNHRPFLHTQHPRLMPDLKTPHSIVENVDNIALSIRKSSTLQHIDTRDVGGDIHFSTGPMITST